jgi:exo-beta-1,3-glucanase (GH17 family)
MSLNFPSSSTNDQTYTNKGITWVYSSSKTADSTVELLEQIKYLSSGHKIRVYANVGNRLEAIISGKLL